VPDQGFFTPCAVALDFAKIDRVGPLVAGVCFAGDAAGVGFPCGAAGSSPRTLAEIAPRATEAARVSNQHRTTRLGNMLNLLKVL
jgi:hypothetical protein